MSRPGSVLWLARHEARLGWRDLHYMLTAGGRWHLWKVGTVLLLAVALLHLIAYGMVMRHAGLTLDSGPAVFSTITGSFVLIFLLMLSQSLEQVTRLFYGRGDLDLLRSSPVSLRRLFSLRVAAVAVSTIAMAMVVIAPFIDVLSVLGGARWLSGFGVAVSAGLAASGLALLLSSALFDTLGPKRTRLAAQIVSAVIGSAFVIGIQVMAVLSIGSMSQQALFGSALAVDYAPTGGSVLWLPARAILGDGAALLALLAGGVLLLVLPMLLLSGRLVDYASATVGGAMDIRLRRGVAGVFRKGSPRQLLRRKEWVLLRRDSWLASQTLMQLLYLIPPALLLWRYYGDSQGSLVVLAPVLTMAAGQLGGGLAWLAVSGEDAPDLIASAPLPAGRALLAKVEAVIMVVFAVFAPFLLALLFYSPRVALTVAAGIGLAALSSTLIQIWFRSQAKRRYFRRRQTSSRIATFAEAFSSVTWAAAAATAVSPSWLAIGPAAIALIILMGAWAIRPR